VRPEHETRTARIPRRLRRTQERFLTLVGALAGLDKVRSKSFVNPSSEPWLAASPSCTCVRDRGRTRLLERPERIGDDESAKGHNEFRATMAEHRSSQALREAVTRKGPCLRPLPLRTGCPVRRTAFRPPRAIVSGTACRLAAFSASVPVMSKSGLLRRCPA